MFVQVIEGRVADREALHRQMDRWHAELRPGATGFLGSTAGVADDGRALCFARFESAAAAQANSSRSSRDSGGVRRRRRSTGTSRSSIPRKSMSSGEADPMTPGSCRS